MTAVETLCRAGWRGRTKAGVPHGTTATVWRRGSENGTEGAEQWAPEFGGAALGTEDQWCHHHDTEVRKGSWCVDNVQDVSRGTGGRDSEEQSPRTVLPKLSLQGQFKKNTIQ